MKNSAVSVVICTRNRAHPLEKLLTSFLASSRDDNSPLEIVIVDNGSADGTANAVEKFKAKAPMVVKNVYEPSSGWGAAKNAGIRAASGDIILFTDDDCIVSSDWVDRFRDLFGACTEARVIGGRVELYNESHSRITIKDSMEREILHSPEGLFGFVHGCNFGVARTTLEAVGMFDTRFGPGSRMKSCSDADFVYRAMRIGIPIVYDPGPVVFHNHGRSSEESVRSLMNRYAMGRGALAMKYFFLGDATIAKVVYWQLRGQWRDCRRKRVAWRLFFSEFTNVMKGGVRYLLFGLGRSSV